MSAAKKRKKTRQKPLQLSYGLLSHTLYPSLVRSLYSGNPGLAIMMWAVVDRGGVLTPGVLSGVLKKPVVACGRFLCEMARMRMLRVTYSEAGCPESTQYAVNPVMCLEAPPADRPTVYE